MILQRKKEISPLHGKMLIEKNTEYEKSSVWSHYVKHDGIEELNQNILFKKTPVFCKNV